MDGSSNIGPGGLNNKSNLSRAEQFENEKKRITESCFSKREEDGTISESYITHLRVEEDAVYQSTPPPPTSNPDAKKPRTIIVAVRKTGRVRVHKARENANGTFSIGKTWVLDDLTAVQSYTGPSTGPNGEQHKIWAGSTGFVVNLGKPYFWKSNSQKEKQFFIASLVKIYHKYTGGKLPELIGFDQREREQLSRVATPSRPPQSSPPAPNLSQLQTRTPRDPLVNSIEPIGDTVQRPPPSPSGKTPITNAQVRNKPSSLNDNLDLNAPSSISVRPKQSLTRMKSSQSQQSIDQNDDGLGFAPQTHEFANETSNPPSRFPNFNMTTDSQRSFALEGSLKEIGNDLQPTTSNTPAPLSLASDTRRPHIQNRSESREKISGPNKNVTSAPMFNPSMRRDGNLRSRSIDRVNLTDHNNTDGESGSVSGGASGKKLLKQSVSSSALKTVDQPHQEELRQGFGPLLKAKAKADVGGILIGAANAFNSLKPRVGGTSDRLKDVKGKTHEDLDRPTSNTSSSVGPEIILSQENEDISEKKVMKIQSDPIFQDEFSTSIIDGVSEKSKLRDIKWKNPPMESLNKGLATIGVDPLILGGRGGDLVDAWEQFGWVGEGIRTKNIDEMKDEVDRELCRIQAGGWLSRLEEEDERIEAIKMGFDKVVEECDELDGLLTLYLVELGTLNEDVAYIEAQSQGLQVQTANQKLLQAELQSLLQTISISQDQIESLRESSLESTRGLTDIERSLVILFKAMLTIDPSLGVSSPRRSEDGSLVSGKPGTFGSSEIGSMRVLQEKKDIYKTEISIFIRRLRSFLHIQFAAAFDQTRQLFEREKGSNLARTPGRVKLDFGKHDLARSKLWKYSPLMLFTREVDRLEWENVMKMYGTVLTPLYQEEFREAVLAAKSAARKPNGDESEVLFTSQLEKQTEGFATTARKLTAMKSQNLAKSLLSPSGENSKSNLDKGLGLEPYEAVEDIICKMASIMSMEQNFFVEFFHVTSLGLHDFPEVVAASSPEERHGVDIRRPRVMDPNRDLAMLVVQSMEEIFLFFPKDIQGLLDWSLQSDPLQVVGIIAALERKIPEYEETNQEYLNRTLQKIHTQLIGLFIKFLDDQIRVIEETNVKIKKRKGVIGFIKTFPLFSSSIERKLSGAQDLEIRVIVNNAYSRVNKAMFEVLKVIARENPGAQITGSDQADKEALNYEIMMMQNMHYYLEEVEFRSNSVLEEWKQNAANEMDEHMSLYLNAVIRRPLGKLLDFLESTESMMLSREPGESISKISGMPSHSKSTFKKVISSYDPKEIKRGIEALKKRVEKHFGEEHDSGITNASDLVTNVIQGCEKYYEDVENRILTISRDVYDGEVVAEWTRADISAAFRK